MLLARRRVRHLGVGLWLDGLIATITATALLGVFVLGEVVDAYGGKLSRRWSSTSPTRSAI